MAVNEGQEICVIYDETKFNESQSIKTQFNEQVSTKNLSGEPRSNWVLCLCAFFVAFFSYGLNLVFGVSYDRFLTEFQQNISKTAWLGSMAQFIVNCSGPFASAFSKRYGAHITIMIGGLLIFSSFMLTSLVPKLEYMYFTYGILFGLGMNFSYTSTIIVIGTSFGKSRSLALCLMSSGVNIGMLTLAPFISALFDLYGWRDTYRILAVLCLSVILCGFAFRPSVCLPYVKTTKTKEAIVTTLRQCFSKDLFQSKTFLTYTIATLFITFGCYIPYTFLVRYGRELGISTSKSAKLITYVGSAAVVGKIVFGFVADLERVNEIALYQAGLFIAGLTAIICSLGSSYSVLLSFALIYGFMDAAVLGITVQAIIEIVEPTNVCCAFGTVYFMQAFTFLLGPPITGYFVDEFASTSRPMLFFTGIPLIIGSIILFYITCQRKRTVKNTKENP